MYCTQCRAERADADRFCRACGAPAAPEAEAPVVEAPVAEGAAPAAVGVAQVDVTVSQAAPIELEEPATDTRPPLERPDLEALLADPVAASCGECGATLRAGTAFCSACGAKVNGAAPTSAKLDAPPTTAKTAEPAEPAAAEPVADARPEPVADVRPKPVADVRPKPAAAPPPERPKAAPAPLPASAGWTERLLLPSMPFKLVWSPRKPYVVDTRLSDRQVGEAFTATMTRKPNVLRRSGNYFRRVRWDVQRNAISGQLVATCKADGPVAVGIGKSKFYVNPTGDTYVCDVGGETRGRREVAMAPGRYTTWLGMYLFPATVYTRDFVKEVRRRDPSATVRHPWSLVRMVLIGIVALLLLISAVPAGGGSSDGSADSSSSTTVVSGDDSLGDSSAATDDADTGDTGEASAEPAEGTLPARPSRDPASLAAEITQAEAIIADPSAPEEDVAAAGRFEQLATRRLVRGDSAMRRETLAALEPDARAAMRTSVTASDALASIVPPQKRFPRWRIVKPPSAERLLRYYKEAGAEYGIGWEYLAAIHFLETRVGRIRGDSVAGAQGPMQFIPETWARYGSGNVNSARDAIMAAANLLSANGAPDRMSDALWRYNPSDGYVRAISLYARHMRRHERAYHGYYHWQVLYKHVSGTKILPEGYPRVRPQAIG